MRLLVVTLHYPPDGGPSAPLHGMLCESLARRGIDVTVIAAVPHYPSGRVPTAYRRGWIKRAEENGVHVIRIGVPSVDRSRLALRTLQLLAFQAGAAISGQLRRYDIALFSNPGMDFWLPFFAHVVLRRIPAVFNVADVYPDVGIALGLFRTPGVVWAVSALERFCLRHSSAVRIISESFVPSILGLGVPESKIVLIYDYVDTELIKPVSRQNAFATENQLLARFVVLYAGNIGLSQGLETVVGAAEKLSSYPDILFLIVGAGAGRASLAAEVQRRGLSNVRLLPFQPRVRLPEVLSSADISLVVLKKGIGIQSLPSKIFSILASGKPLLASIDEHSATARLVQKAEAGLCVPPEDPGQLADSILKFRNASEWRERMGRNGRRFAIEHHSPEVAAQQFEILFRRIIAERRLSRSRRALDVKP